MFHNSVSSSILYRSLQEASFIYIHVFAGEVKGREGGRLYVANRLTVVPSALL